MPLYKEVRVGEKKFILVHGGLSGFSLFRPLENYESDEILWSCPEPDTDYYPDKLLIFDHTPTQLLYAETRKDDETSEIFRTDTFIDIDCGCVFQGGRLGCLCLDTMEEIYI